MRRERGDGLTAPTPWCRSAGHEKIPAVWVGTLYPDADPADRFENTPYCQECVDVLREDFKIVRPTSWGQVAFFPRERYWLRETKAGWEVWSANADGAFS